MAPQRTVYINGEFLPESEGFVHFRDRGFVYGDAAFDTSRTFGGRVFRLGDHLDRLFRSLQYLRIDPGMTRAEMAGITEELLDRNRPLLEPGQDFWVTQRVSRGLNRPADPDARAPATVVVECAPLPLSPRAVLYRDGADIRLTRVRRTPPESLNPKAKTQNYLNMIVAGFEVEGLGPRAWPILLDTRGYVAEGRGSNVFIVRGGELLTPRSAYVLPGVTRSVVLQLAVRAGLSCREADLSPEDLASADEAMLTSTSLGICPVSSVNGAPLFDGAAGPVTRSLMGAFAREVDYDYVAQYLSHLPDEVLPG